MGTEPNAESITERFTKPGEPDPSARSGVCELRLEASARWQHFAPHCGGHNASCLVVSTMRQKTVRIVSAKRCGVSPRPSATAAAQHLFKVRRMAVHALRTARVALKSADVCSSHFPAKNEVVVGAARQSA